MVFCKHKNESLETVLINILLVFIGIHVLFTEYKRNCYIKLSF